MSQVSQVPGTVWKRLFVIPSFPRIKRSCVDIGAARDFVTCVLFRILFFLFEVHAGPRLCYEKCNRIRHVFKKSLGQEKKCLVQRGVTRDLFTKVSY